MKGSKRMVPLLDVRSSLLTMVTGRVSTPCRVEGVGVVEREVGVGLARRARTGGRVLAVDRQRTDVLGGVAYFAVQVRGQEARR